MNPMSEDIAFLAQATLLLVEDDDAARVQLATALRRRTGKVLTAAGGAEGLELFRAERPQLVVTDIQMPGLDGLDMALAIRDLDPRVPIIVLTAFEQTDYMARAIDLGISHYVIKPLQLDRLEEKLVKCAHGLRAERELARKYELELELERLRHHESLNFLLTGFAHDCNNLMQAILSSLTLAKGDLPPGTPARSFLEIGEQGLLEARQLGSRLRILTDPWREPDRLGPIGEQVRRAVQGALEGTATTVAFNFGDGDLPIRFHEARLGQTLAALARNATEAMAGGGALQVTTEVAEPAGRTGRYLHLVFRDSGPGIDPGVLPMIFEPYFTTKPRGSRRGTGLGLAVCEAVVRAHGGWIEADSRPGEGAAFHLYLPEASV